MKRNVDKKLKDIKSDMNKSLQIINKELKKIYEDVIPGIDELVENTKIPFQNNPPTELHQSGLWWNTSQEEPKLMRWDANNIAYLPLTPSKDEIRKIMGEI